MDDNLSIKSNDSVTISGEYEIVADGIDTQANAAGASPSPTLKIANNGDHNDLEKNLTEMICEMDANALAANAPGRLYLPVEKHTHTHILPNNNKLVNTLS